MVLIGNPISSRSQEKQSRPSLPGKDRERRRARAREVTKSEREVRGREGESERVQVGAYGASPKDTTAHALKERIGPEGRTDGPVQEKVLGLTVLRRSRSCGDSAATPFPVKDSI